MVAERVDRGSGLPDRLLADRSGMAPLEREVLEEQQAELVRREVSVPLIASGGAGRVEDFVPAVKAGADAVLAASVFHFGTLTVAEVKSQIAAAGYPVR